MARIPLRAQPAGQELFDAEVAPDWGVVFGGPGPLELEIGSGLGGFALEYCQRHPHVRLVAFEWRKKYAREVVHRGQKLGLTNLRVLECDAREALPRLFLPGSLSAIHVQFPDPWWKRAHQKRAVVSSDFAPTLVGLLAPGGLFDLRTDVEDRARAMLAVLEGAGLTNPLGPGAFHPYDPSEVPSTRERRYLTSGAPVYRARLRKPFPGP